MNKDLIETPRFNFFIGDEVLLKGKIVGFDVDENKCVENVVRLEYGQTLNVPNNNICITDDIVDKSKIKVVVPQFVADWIEVCKEHLTTSLYTAMTPNFMKENNQSFDLILWIKKASNQDLFARAWLDGYEVEEEKRYLVTLKNRQPLVKSQSGSTLYFSQDITARNYKGTQKELEDANFGWVFDCEGIEIEEVE
ncbi:phage protein [Streptococcus pneumoniae]|nr:phage protein [Streptococcus pneumoniae]VRO84028.1 phage protein [Streptococcus pneumoniae]